MSTAVDNHLGISPILTLGLRRVNQEEREQFSDRELWWRRTLKDTPLPGKYEVKTFIDDLNAEPIKKSYGFKSEGRKRNADPSRKGHYLMPGLYEAKGCMDELKSKKITYSFSSTDRNNVSAVVSGIKDKEIAKSQIGPTSYDPGYVPVEKSAVRHPAFKSQSRRFPTIYFKPKEGPAPGQYEQFHTSEVNSSLKTTSAFKSRTPRFTKPHVLKTPGPGSYTKMMQTPMPSHIRYLGRYHGLFFPPGVY